MTDSTYYTGTIRGQVVEFEAPSSLQRGVEALTIKCSPSLDGFNFINRLEIKRKGTGESSYSTVLEVIDPPRGSNPNFKDGTFIFSKKTIYIVLTKSNCHNKIFREEVITLILYNHIICTRRGMAKPPSIVQCLYHIYLCKKGESSVACVAVDDGLLVVVLLLLLCCCCCCSCCCC